ncbi:MAG TPA: hypothetical protein PKB09_00650 [Candidatus Saccharibacteria bacterium]|nr:hypothetical protein [Candidatus Saccharibacteria bacterium]
MLTPSDYSEHHRPYVDNNGLLSPRFYDPDITHEQYFRYETTPTWSDSEARIRFREFGYLGYLPISHIEWDDDLEDFPIRQILNQDIAAQELLSYGALVGPWAIDFPEMNRTELLSGIVFFKRPNSIRDISR